MANILMNCVVLVGCLTGVIHFFHFQKLANTKSGFHTGSKVWVQFWDFGKVFKKDIEPKFWSALCVIGQQVSCQVHIWVHSEKKQILF